MADLIQILPWRSSNKSRTEAQAPTLIHRKSIYEEDCPFSLQ